MNTTAGSAWCLPGGKEDACSTSKGRSISGSQSPTSCVGESFVSESESVSAEA